MTSSAFARPGVLARFAAALAALAVLASCSSNVSGPVPVNDPDRITIQPETAVLYSGLETTFTVSGGTGIYSISSSNQSIVQVPSFLNGRTFSVTPANVVADTAVTITVRDSGTAPVASATLTVRAGTVSNEIVISPTGTQGGDCAPAVCSGGDAVLFARITQGGVPLPARGVRLDVVSGDFRFVTSAPGQSEVLSTSTTVISDQAGGVIARIRALAGANNQTAVVQVTDLGTQAFRRATFEIAQATGSSPGFFTVPSEITFSGPNTLSCALGARADVSIFGGSPPYTVGNGGSAFSVSDNSISQRGGSFYIVASGVCAEDVPIVVMDSAGRTTTVLVSNVLGTLEIPELLVSPSTVTLSDCNANASVTVAGGIPGSFTVTNTSGAIFASPNPSSRVITIARTPNSTASTPLSIGVASGDKVATITVILTGDALNTRCDGSTLSITPSTLSFAGCGFADVLVSGGLQPYTAISNSSVLQIVPPGTHGQGPNIIRVQRALPSAAPTGPQTITIYDSTSSIPRVSRTVTATVTGTCS